MPWPYHRDVSVRVELDELRDRVDEHGTIAFLTTVGEHGPHIVSVEVGWSGDMLRAHVGTTTAANARARPAVSLLWPALAGAEYALIVDGVATAESSSDSGPTSLALRPERAVLHRLAGAPGQGPSCVTVLHRSAPE